MAAALLSRRFTAILFLLLSESSCIFAQTASASQTPTSAATTKYSPYPTSTDVAGGTYAGDTTIMSSTPTDAAGENAAGASGGQGGSVNLSMGSIIAIVVVVAVVIIFGAATAVLFFVAKKRQWKVRQSIRRTASRVTSMVIRPKTPRTPRSKPMTFPSVSEVSSSDKGSSPPRKDMKAPLKIDTTPANMPRSSTPVVNTLPPALAAKKHQKTQSQQIRSRSSERRLDLEKRPRPVTASAFDMDSPVKGSIWTKMFGKK